MKRIVIIFTVFLSFLSSCTAQNADKKKAKEKDINPKTDIVVNKEYDDEGNLIKYDSTYTYYYTNFNQDNEYMDSVYNAFKEHFNSSFYFSHKPFFQDLFFEDSLLKYDFYKNDFFKQRFRSNMSRMDELFWEMDSLKNEFYRHFKDF